MPDAGLCLGQLGLQGGNLTFVQLNGGGKLALVELTGGDQGGGGDHLDALRDVLRNALRNDRGVPRACGGLHGIRQGVHDLRLGTDATLHMIPDRRGRDPGLALQITPGFPTFPLHPHQLIFLLHVLASFPSCPAENPQGVSRFPHLTDKVCQAYHEATKQKEAAP